MSDTLRHIYNAIDTLFDRRAISEQLHFGHDGGETKHAITALQAFKTIWPHVRSHDRKARLKSIVSQQGVNANGTSSHWEFFFDLTQRRAQLICEWVLPWDERTDDYRSARIEINIKPFPATDSLIRQLVATGKLLHRQMVGLWKQECKRLPNLPHKFRDTDAVLEEFVQQGLDPTQIEFSLHTGQSPKGRLCWIAQTKRDIYYAAFE